MNFYVLVAPISLVLQILILFLLLGSIWFKAAKKFRQHGLTMLTAVVLHTTTIVAVMIPSFGGISSGHFSTVISALAILHGTLGALAEILGVWVVASWRLRDSQEHCISKRRVMRLTLVTWIIAIILGVLIYLNFYTSVLKL